MNLKKTATTIAAGAILATTIGAVTATPAQAAAPRQVYTGQACQSFGSTGVWPWRTTWTLIRDTVDQCGYRKKVQSGAFYSYTQTVYIGKIRKDCGPAWYQQNC